jgi:sterol desaturase/sphingolipid hydroxylase (fatty acid hydroxylase superfamily)
VIELSSFLSSIWHLALGTISQPLLPTHRLFWGYLASALLVALIMAACAAKKAGLPAAKAILLPPGTGSGFWLDLQLFVANGVLFGLGLTSFLFSEAWVYGTVSGYLRESFGAPVLRASFWTNAVYTLGILFVYDASRYFGHRLQHRVPFLWELHKVHHSARTLTPLTLFRTHPLADLVLSALSALATGAFSAAFRSLFRGTIEYSVMGVNALLFASYLLASLRHSHVPLGFGRVFSHVFISPHQHQVHHSSLREHYDKNFGVTFALWDWLFGTLYIPQRDERFEFGLGAAGAGHHSLWQSYVQPLIEIGRSSGKSLVQVGSRLGFTRSARARAARFSQAARR